MSAFSILISLNTFKSQHNTKTGKNSARIVAGSALVCFHLDSLQLLWHMNAMNRRRGKTLVQTNMMCWTHLLEQQKYDNVTFILRILPYDFYTEGFGCEKGARYSKCYMFYFFNLTIIYMTRKREICLQMRTHRIDQPRKHAKINCKF